MKFVSRTFDFALQTKIGSLVIEDKMQIYGEAFQFLVISLPDDRWKSGEKEKQLSFPSSVAPLEPENQKIPRVLMEFEYKSVTRVIEFFSSRLIC